MNVQGRLIRRKLRFERDFTQTPNSWLRDSQLSWRARGILNYLLSHETGFSVTLKALAGESPSEGIDAVRAAVNELEKAGYLRRYSSSRGGRFRADDWEITDPAAMGAPSLLPALDKTTRRSSTALDKPTRTALDKATRKSEPALDEPTRDALDEPTAIRTLEEHSREISSASHKSVMVTSLGKLCIAEGHVWQESGWCARCGDRLAEVRHA